MVVVPKIDVAGCDAIAEHLGNIPDRHLQTAKTDRAILSWIVVDPVLKMVRVAALVVQPGQ